MKIIVGLGNPGLKYAKTRHNIGFMIVEQFFKNFATVEKTVWDDSKKFKSDIAEFEYKPKRGPLERVMLCKPKTYMNNSGMAVSLVSLFYKIKAEDIWVVYDELDLPLGSMKIRFAGASAGHHGIDSLIEKLGTDKFWRFRMGIGVNHNHSEMAKYKIKNAEDYVLGGFTGAQGKKARDLVKRGAKALSSALEHGIETAMNQYNTK